MRILLITLLFIGFVSVCLLPPQALAKPPDDVIKFYLPLEGDHLKPAVRQLAKQLHAGGLTQILPVAVRYWTNYQQGLRHGSPGIYLAAPHFAAWAINEHKFLPLVRLNQPLQYVIAVRRTDHELFEINDLDRQYVCAQRPLNLDYLLVNQAFDKPLMAANILSVDSVQQEMQSIRSACKGFALSDHLFQQLAGQHPEKYIRLQQGASLNNYVIIAHPGVPVAQLELLQKLLKRPEAQAPLSTILRQFSSSGDLVPARAADYPQDYMKVLSTYW